MFDEKIDDGDKKRQNVSKVMKCSLLQAKMQKKLPENAEIRISKLNNRFC